MADAIQIEIDRLNRALYQKCRACDGATQVEGENWPVLCGPCKGSGLRWAGLLLRECVRCLWGEWGSGKHQGETRETCIRCNGTSWVTIKNAGAYTEALRQIKSDVLITTGEEPTGRVELYLPDSMKWWEWTNQQELLIAVQQAFVVACESC